jgi:hypothetical protein
MGTPPLSYQWLLNGAPIEGATTTCYVNSAVEVQDEGWYSVIVSNAWGSATSQPPAKVTVAIPHAATATAVVLNGWVVGVTNLWGGWGYTNTPRVRIIDVSGSGVQAVAVVSNGVVVAINIPNPGSGYTDASLVVIAPPFIESPRINIAALSLLSFTNLTVGTFYQLQSVVGGTLTDIGPFFRATNTTNTLCVSGSVAPNAYRLAKEPVPRQASATAQVANCFVVGATVVDGGSGYTTNPTVVIRGILGAGSNATAIAYVSGGSVTNIVITNPGNGYCNRATIIIDPPPATILWPNNVAQAMELHFGGLSRYDNYQLDIAPVVSGSWSNLVIPFIPTSNSSTQTVTVNGDIGFFRVGHLP